MSSWHMDGKSGVHLAVRSRIQGSGTQWVDLRLWQHDFVLPPGVRHGWQSPRYWRPMVQHDAQDPIPSSRTKFLCSALAAHRQPVHWQPRMERMHVAETELVIVSPVPRRTTGEARVAVADTKIGWALLATDGMSKRHILICAHDPPPVRPLAWGEPVRRDVCC